MRYYLPYFYILEVLVKSIRVMFITIIISRIYKILYKKYIV